MTSSMSTYKCRADCSADILKVLKAYRNWLVINDYENDLKTIKMEKLYLKGAGIDGTDVFCGEMEWTFSIDTGQYDWTADDYPSPICEKHSLQKSQQFHRSTLR